MINHVSSTNLSTLLIIVKLILTFQMKSHLNLLLNGYLFQKKNSRVLSANITTHQLLNQIKFLQRFLKRFINNEFCLIFIINITNTYINLGHWPSHFKTSTLIIIPKPNKSLYDSPKSFQPIVLFDILGKLIEKVIGEIMQFHTISNNFVHQFEELK